MEELSQEIDQIIDAESGGNTTFEQIIEERLTDSVVKLQRLQTDMEQFKNNQLGELTVRQTNSLLGTNGGESGSQLLHHLLANSHTNLSSTHTHSRHQTFLQTLQ